MKFKFILFALNILLISCDGCKDDPKPKTELEKLPPATQEGKNTFGCLVDGKAWVPRTSIDSYAYYQSGVLVITAFNTGETDAGEAVNQGMSITVRDQNLSEREYSLDQVDELSDVANFGDDLAECSFRTTADYTGKVTITHLDQSPGKWIISGTFEFEAYSNDCQKV